MKGGGDGERRQGGAGGLGGGIEAGITSGIMSGEVLAAREGEG